MNCAADAVLVTGASRGIGRAIALAFAGQGVRVIGTATSEAGAAGITEALATTAGGGLGKVLDAAVPESVAHLFAELASEGLTPGIIVNNAGIARDALLARMSESDWSQVIETNLGSVYRVCRAAARHLMKRRGGRIINISSVVAAMGNPGQVNYAAAKGGVEAFTRSLACELAPRGVTVNAVAPGFIETDMTARLEPEKREALARRIPLGRLGSADDVAAAVLFLASDGAAYITGEVLNVNGGMYMA